MIYTCLLWGSIWGIIEVTLGYLLHIIDASVGSTISGFIMFPIAFYFMRTSFRSTNKVSSIFTTALIAATIKLTNLFFTLVVPVHTIMPAIAILLEGGFVYVGFRYFMKTQNKFYLAESFLISIGWRSVFLLFVFFMAINNNIIPGGILSILKFIIIDGIAPALIVSFLMRVETNYKVPVFKPAISVIAFISAVLIQILIIK